MTNVVKFDQVSVGVLSKIIQLIRSYSENFISIPYFWLTINICSSWIAMVMTT